MPYVLGIDVGTSHTAAAVCPLDGWDGPTSDEATVVRLGDGAGSAAETVPSLLYLTDDGSVEVGEPAAQRAAVESGRIARGFIARIGDDVPMVVGGAQYLPQDLAAALITWVADQVEAQQGGPAEHVVVTHGSSWGNYRRGLLHRALRRVGLVNVTLLPKPIAAAECHAARHQVAAGSLLAIYDLGGEQFETAVVRRTDTGMFRLIGHAEDAEGLGGVAFDDALAEHVRTELGSRLADLSPADPQDRLTALRLRQECVAAKERLSAADKAVVSVRAGGVRTDVRLTRAQFEEMIEPAVRQTVDRVLRCGRSLGVQPQQLAAAVLVGGSSRIPLVATAMAAQLPGGVAVEPEPETAVARGAALAALRSMPTVAEPRPPMRMLAVPEQRRVDPNRTVDMANPVNLASTANFADEHEADFAEQPPPRPPVDIVTLELPQPRSAGQLAGGSKPMLVGAVVSVVVIVGLALTFVFFIHPPRGATPAQTPLSPTTAVTEPVSRPAVINPSEDGR